MTLKLSVASLAFAGLVSMASTQAASAAVILTFGQTAPGNTIVGTNNGAGSTTIAASNVGVDITQIFGGGTPMATLNLTATSTGAATVTGGNVVQSYSGSFSITGGGNNYLSGTFTDAVFGAMGGPSLTLSASQPPDSVMFTSSVIPMDQLGLARGMSLSFANVTPLVGVTNNSLSSFASSVSGTFSANVGVVVPEPASLFLFGAGLATLAVRARRRKA